jgi:hypothetical protein
MLEFDARFYYSGSNGTLYVGGAVGRTPFTLQNIKERKAQPFCRLLHKNFISQLKRKELDITLYTEPQGQLNVYEKENKIYLYLWLGARKPQTVVEAWFPLLKEGAFEEFNKLLLEKGESKISLEEYKKIGHDSYACQLNLDCVMRIGTNNIKATLINIILFYFSQKELTLLKHGYLSIELLGFEPQKPLNFLIMKSKFKSDSQREGYCTVEYCDTQTSYFYLPNSQCVEDNIVKISDLVFE